MTETLRIVHLEDIAEDSELIAEALRDDGLVCDIRRVDNRDDYERQLAEFHPDIILADYRLPRFDGAEALALARSRYPEIPVVMVTGAIGDEKAVELLKAGACDYVLKDRLHRLGQAILRALAERRAQQQRRQTEQESARLAAVVKQAGDAIVIAGVDGVIDYVNPDFCAASGYTADEAKGRNLLALGGNHDDDFYRRLWQTVSGGQSWAGRLEGRRKDGSVIHEDATIFPVRGTDDQIIAYAAVKKDVTARMQAESRIRKLSRLYAALSHTNQAIVRAKSRPQLFQDICIAAVAHGRFAAAWVGLSAPGSARLEPQCHHSAKPDFLALLRSLGNSDTPGAPIEDALRDNRVTVVRDISADARFIPYRREALQSGFVGVAALPLRFEGDVIGAVVLYADEANYFDAEQMALLEEMCTDISFAIDGFARDAQRQRAQAERETALLSLRRALEGSIRVATSIIEMRDPYTAGHQRRVAKLATAIATELRLSPTQIEAIHFGGLIHDIGKISIPAEILSRPAHLSALELGLVRTHSAVGYEIVKDVDFPWPLAQIIHQHHERLDGSGYPGQIVSEQILPEAKILAVADVVEAMSSHRPYRPSLGMDQALREVEGGRDKLFDASAVDACLRLFQQHAFSFDDDQDEPRAVKP
jgi:PAS domain S-box-containing protein/putative nucleotidyltransferase with HDIG domain